MAFVDKKKRKKKKNRPVYRVAAQLKISGSIDQTRKTTE